MALKGIKEIAKRCQFSAKFSWDRNMGSKRRIFDFILLEDHP